MKVLYLLILGVCASMIVFSQSLPSQIQAKNGVFTERLFLKDRWINSISGDLNTDDSTSDNVLATGKAIADFIRAKTSTDNSIQNQFSAAQPANFRIHGTAVMGSQSLFKNTLASGFPAQAYVTQSGSQYGLSVQRASADQGAPSIVLFKNYAADFGTLNALQPGDSIGSIIFSGVAGDNSTVKNVMSIHGEVEKTGPGYLSSGFVFNTTDTNGVYARRLTLDAQGNLMIGSGTTPNPYKLNVASGDVRFNSLSGSGDVLTGSDNNGVLKKITLGDNLYINDGVLNVSLNNGGPAYTYIATMSQSGTNNPTVFALEGNLGITWTRNAPGDYTATAINGFPDYMLFHTEASDETGNVVFTRMYRTARNTARLIVKNGSLTNTDGFTNLSIEITGYLAN